MKITQFKSLMKKMTESNGEYIYTAYVPSLDRELSFRSATAGEIKTVAKSKMPDSYIPDDELARLELIEKLLIRGKDDEDLDIVTLTNIDITSILASIRINNPISKAEFNIQCTEKECKHDFKLILDFEYIVKNCKKYKLFEDVIEIKANDGTKFKFVLEEPSMLLEINYNIYAKAIMELKTLQEEDKYSILMSSLFVKYTKELYINDELVEDFLETPFIDKIKLVDDFPSEIVYGENGIVMTSTNKLNSISENNKVFQTVACPVCKHEIVGGLNLNSFFIV